MISFCHYQLKIRIEIRDEIVEIVESRSRKFAMPSSIKIAPNRKSLP